MSRGSCGKLSIVQGTLCRGDVALMLPVSRTKDRVALMLAIAVSIKLTPGLARYHIAVEGGILSGCLDVLAYRSEFSAFGAQAPSNL